MVAPAKAKARRPRCDAMSCARTAEDAYLRNRQRLRRVNLRLLRQIVQALLQETWPDGGFDLAIYLVAAPEMTRLNETFLRHKGSTDVITFDYTESVGQGSRLSNSGHELPPVGTSETPVLLCCTGKSLSAWTRRCPRPAVSTRPGRANWFAMSFMACCTCSATTIRKPGSSANESAEDALVRRLARQFASSATSAEPEAHVNRCVTDVEPNWNRTGTDPHASSSL